MVADVNFRAEKRDTFGTLVDEEQPLAPDFIGFPRALSYIWLTKRALRSFFPPRDGPPGDWSRIEIPAELIEKAQHQPDLPARQDVSKTHDQDDPMLLRTVF